MRKRDIQACIENKNTDNDRKTKGKNDKQQRADNGGHH